MIISDHWMKSDHRPNDVADQDQPKWFVMARFDHRES